MKKQLTLITAVFSIIALLMGTTSLQAQQKQVTPPTDSILVVNLPQIFKDYSLAQQTREKITQMEKELEEKNKAKVDELNKLGHKYNELMVKIKDEDSPLQGKALDDAKKELVNLKQQVDDMNRARQESIGKLAEEFQEKRAQLVKARESEVEAEVQKIAKKLNASHVLNTETPAGPNVLYVRDEFDITSQVIANLNKAHPVTTKK